MSVGGHLCRAKLAELFASRETYHAGIADSMPNGVMGQDFAVQYLKVTVSSKQARTLHHCASAAVPPMTNTVILSKDAMTSTSMLSAGKRGLNLPLQAVTDSAVCGGNLIETILFS